MQPSPAEVARTIAAGHLPASAHIACCPDPLPVRHVTDRHGRILLLSPSDGALTAALRTADDTALVLDIADIPPMAGSPTLGRVWVSGWGRRLDGDEARAATLDYADIDADGDLLDVGVGQVLHRMEVAEVRHERHGVLNDIDPDEYAAASPDPLRHIEFDLIADLADHHLAEMAAYVRRRLGPAAQPTSQPASQPAAQPASQPASQPVEEPHVVRIDRYGLLVRLDGRVARLAFARPVTDRHDLAHLLHPALCHRCSG